MKIDTLLYEDGYEAIVVRHWRCESPIRPEEDVITATYSILRDGTIIAEKNYPWDFATGAFDTLTIIRGSLAHDIICQAIAEGRLDKKWQKPADRLLKRICKLDGMARFRAWYVYRGVRAYQKRKRRILFDAHPVKSIPPDGAGL